MTTSNTQPKTTAGFTLIETLVALSLSVFIVMSVSQIFIEGIQHVYGVRAQALLTSDAGYMVQVIRNELFSADSVSVPNTSTVALVQGGTPRTLTVVDERLVFDGEHITRDGVRVTNLVFTQVGESVRIQFTLYSGPRTNKTLSGQTTLAFRT